MARQWRNRDTGAMVGMTIGAVVGYPISYFFQPGLVRAILSVGQYVEKIGDVIHDNGLRSTAFGVWFAAVLAGALIGFALGKRGEDKMEL